MAPHAATRRNGICKGSLYKQHFSVAIPPSVSDMKKFNGDINERRSKSHDYCALIGNTLFSYPDIHSYYRGDFPMTEVRIVGASAWNPPPPSASLLNTLFGSSKAKRRGSEKIDSANNSGHGSTASGSNHDILSTTASGVTSSTSTASMTNSTTSSFQIVTYAGTHIYCSAPSVQDRDTWLAALHSGLEASYALYHETLLPSSSSSSSNAKNNNSNCVFHHNEILNSEEKQLYYSSLSSPSQRILTPPPKQKRSFTIVPSTSSQSYCLSCGKLALTSAEKSAASSLSSSSGSTATSSIASLTTTTASTTTMSISAMPHATNQSSSSNSSSLTTTTTTTTTTSLSSASSSSSSSMAKKKKSIPFHSSAAPLPQYGMEGRADLCQSCLFAQGILSHVTSLVGLYASHAHERAALQAAQTMAIHAMEKAIQEERQRLQDEEDKLLSLRTIHSSEINVNNGNELDEGSANKFISTNNLGGSWTTISSNNDDPHDANSNKASGTAVTATSQNDIDNNNKTAVSAAPSTPSIDSSSSNPSSSSSTTTTPQNNTHASSTWLHLPPTDAGTKALLSLIQTPGFATFRRRSRALEVHCRRLEHGTIGGAAEFLELLADSASFASATTPSSDTNALHSSLSLPHHAPSSSSEHNKDHSDNNKIINDNHSIGLIIDGLGVVGEKSDLKNVSELKKEAFKVAGDMSAAIKLLSDHALPSARVGDATEFLMANEMLATIFEFLLDLCEEGKEQLESIAFFWPQLKHIHLRMLPAKDADALVRVELMEDFLLTVSARYSVHLGLELVWGLIADLEESLHDPNASYICRARRFPVLRFVCELESVLFGLDGCWGSGSVSLRGVLSPSEHQAMLIKDAMAVLQLHRRYSGHHLTRSVRVDRLVAEAKRDLQRETTDVLGNDNNDTTTSTTTMTCLDNDAKARANFFSSQLEYAKRLGDIAEKLRFMDKEKRSAALEKELKILNAGRMGGDPLSRAGDDIAPVVRLPSKEGHVFRSKERTPILLLMEVLRPNEDVNLDNEENNNAEEETKIQTQEEEYIEKVGDEKDIPVASESLDTDPSIPESRTEDKNSNVTTSADSEIRTISKSHALKPLDSSTLNKEMGEMVAEAVKHQLYLQDSSTRPDSTNIETKTDGTEVDTSNASEINDDQSSSHSSSASIESSKAPSTSDTPQPQKPTTTKNISSPPRTPFRTSSYALKRENSRPKRMSALGSFGTCANESQNGQSSSLSVFGEGRREVLTAIFAIGKQGDTIAKQASKAVKRTLQVMDRERATQLINGKEGSNSNSSFPSMFSPNDSSDDLKSRSGSMHGDDVISKKEDQEAIEALRLLLLQNRVAQDNLSPEEAAKALDLLTSPPEQRLPPKPSANGKQTDMLGEGVADAGMVDPRLSGCGPMSPAIVNAIKMWQDGVVSNAEVLELVQKDLQFLRHALFADTEMASKLTEDSAFWVRFAFGERWAEKKARIAATSAFGAKSGWDLVGVIVKSNDDLRQEAFVMQLIELCREAFENAGLELWVHPYRILATSRTTGIIETVRNAISFDGLKKRPGYGNGGLRGHLIRMTEFDANPKEAFQNAQRNFVRSLAAYSLMSYFFMFKDRHNGNLLLDTAGHVIHIDFGFVFGIAPGGSFSLEMSTPFKLTEEMLEVMDGPASPLFSEFVTLFCCGFLALQKHVDTFCTIVEITCKGSNFKCFEGKNPTEVIDKLRNRFAPGLNKQATVAFALDLINQATSSYGTKQYDFFQYLSQGIAA